MKRKKDEMYKENEKKFISIVSNITLEPYFRLFIKSKFENDSIVIHSIPYGSYKERIEQIVNSDIIIIWINLEMLYLDKFNLINSYQIGEQRAIIEMITSLCKELYNDVVERINAAQIMWFSFEDYYTLTSLVAGNIPFCKGIVSRINQNIYQQLYNKVYFIDLKRLIAQIGIANAYNPTGKYRWNAPYSRKLVEIVIDEIHKQYLIHKGVSKKCLILDCDNVLWGGIISEDGIEGIILDNQGKGRLYQDFQRFVLEMYYHGVMIAICSKNDFSDVHEMFQKHSAMILQEEHIAYFSVNWNNKSDNIKQISQELNIGLESMVFIDDSAAEIEAVKNSLPQVTSVIFDPISIYSQLSCFNLKSDVDIENIKKRNETYRTNQERKILKSHCANYFDYLNSLEMKIDIHKADLAEFNRVSELTQRTNRCTNGKRYTVSEIKKRVASPKVNLYCVLVSDRFSDLGLVGAVEVEDDVITLFSLSCRALERGIENKMLDFVLQKYKINSIEFKNTNKNKEVRAFFERMFPGTVFIKEF